MYTVQLTGEHWNRTWMLATSKLQNRTLREALMLASFEMAELLRDLELAPWVDMPESEVDRQTVDVVRATWQQQLKANEPAGTPAGVRMTLPERTVYLRTSGATVILPIGRRPTWA